MTDGELYNLYLDAAQVGGKENAPAGLRAVFDAGREAEKERVIGILKRVQGQREHDCYDSEGNGYAAAAEVLEEVEKQ